ncbi:hypothetical protein H0H87_004766 [Tephrocybe sp. NHM501043]|nr:hypothetical protein H0H87_004766 [Tephrocybe sp. NHM501043]
MDVMFRGSEAEVEREVTSWLLSSPTDDEDLCQSAYAARWTKDGTGLMARNGLDAGGKLRPSAAELNGIGRTFELTWKNYFEGAPDKPVMWLGTFAAYAGNDPAAPRRNYFSATYYIEYPVSKGRVHIAAGLDPYGRLDFEPGYLDDPADLGVLRWGYKKGREFARRMNIYRGEFVLGHPDFPVGSEASTSGSSRPVGISSIDIHYSDDDDKAIDEYHRKSGSWLNLVA